MKKMNKLMAVAIAAVAIFAIQSCSKTQFQAGNLVGTWTMSEMTQDAKSTETYPNDPTIDGDLIESVYERSIVFSGSSNKTGTETYLETYDGLGAGFKSESGTTTFDGTKVYNEDVEILTDGTTTSFKDTSNLEESMTYTITFEKDKTFSMSIMSTSKMTSTQDNASYSSITTNTSESTNTATGTWAYIGADKNLDVKNKERIGLWFKTNSNNSVNTNTTTYTDKDNTDFIDWTDNNTNDVTTSIYNQESISSTEPSAIWEMVEGTKDEMKVTYMFMNSGSAKTTNSNTAGGTTTTTTWTDYSFTEESSNFVTFTK